MDFEKKKELNFSKCIIWKLFLFYSPRGKLKPFFLKKKIYEMSVLEVWVLVDNINPPEATQGSDYERRINLTNRQTGRDVSISCPVFSGKIAVYDPLSSS